jgi:cytoskeletal protein CcmA (bactofilin family)
VEEDVQGYGSMFAFLRVSPVDHEELSMEATAQIGPSIRIKGNVSAQEPLTIAGEVVGSIDVSGYRLVLTEAARVEADIIAHTVVIGGSLSGRLCAEGAVVVHPTATIAGEMITPAMSVLDGAQLQGKFEVTGTKRALRP